MTSGPEPPSDGADTAAEEPQSSSDGAQPASAGDAGRGTILRSLAPRALEKLRPFLLAVSVIAAVGLAAVVFIVQYHPDRQVDDAAAHRAIKAASDGAVAFLSYSSDSMDRDFTNARSHLTGEFLTYYDKFTKEFVAPTVQKKNLTQTATVVRAAVSELHPKSAVVLVFLNETTTGNDKQKPLMTPSSARITLTKVNGSWLISKFDPVA
jgi:Mce-associated membrane protein